MNRGGILALAVASLAGVGPLRAQRYSGISGIIQDPSAAIVPDAAVTVVNEDTGFRRAVLSGMDGSYAVLSLQPGPYKVTVRKIGFRTMIRFGVRLSDSQPARLDFKLVVGSVQETITVEGSASPLNETDGSVATVIGRNAIANLPVNGHTLLNLLELTPGVVVTPATRGESGQFTINGQRPNTHYFTVDGASANSGVSGGGVPAQSTGGALPGMTAFGSLDATASLDATEEVRVQASTTTPEFGRLPGAQISVRSRSGSNQFHGALLYGFRNESLNANGWFANRHGDSRARERLQNADSSLGGPIWRNRTFFFADYERLRLAQPFVYEAPVPSAAFRAGAPEWTAPVLNLFPSANGPDLGNGLSQWTSSFSRPAGLDTGSARIDQRITSRISAFGRYSDAASSTEFGGNPVDFLYLRSKGVTLGLIVQAKANLVFDLRANASWSGSNAIWRQASPVALPRCYFQPLLAYVFGPAGTCDSLVRLSIAGVGQVVSGSEGLRGQSQYQVAGTAGWKRGAHSIRFGADYRRLAPERRDASGSVSVIADSLSDLADSTSFWKATAAPQRNSAVVRETSLFVQDTWQASRRLTATYGLRWEISPAPTSSGSNYLDPQTSKPLQRPIWGSAYANLAPRFGLAYRVDETGRTVIRAGAGLYYDSSLSLATDLVNNGPLNVSQYGSARGGFVATLLGFGFSPDLHPPRVAEWNVSVEHALGDRDVVSAGYVGASGNDLIRRESGGPESSDRIWLALATNNGYSDYHAMQLQYRRRLGHGLEAIAGYTWSHSIDNSSTDGGLYWLGPGRTAAQGRGSSDFDVRQTLTAGFTYRLRKGWALDGIFRARTGFPIGVLTAGQYLGIPFENTFRPDLVGGQPAWVDDRLVPGGRRLNPAAFRLAQGSSQGGIQGNLGRNALSGFGTHQLDLALGREFAVGENRSVQIRMEAFNALNHPNFADPVRFLASPLFGESSSALNFALGSGSPGSGLTPMFQAGGARSVQLTLRFRF